MQNREELRKKATIGVEKRHVPGGGKNITFRRGGINIVFGPLVFLVGKPLVHTAFHV
jgi:hypothetical protein